MMEKTVWRTSGHGSSPLKGDESEDGIERVLLAGENEACFLITLQNFFLISRFWKSDSVSVLASKQLL